MKTWGFLRLLPQRLPRGEAFRAPPHTSASLRSLLDRSAVGDSLHDRVRDLIRVLAIGKLNRDTGEASPARLDHESVARTGRIDEDQPLGVREAPDGLVEAEIRPFELV